MNGGRQQIYKKKSRPSALSNFVTNVARMNERCNRSDVIQFFHGYPAKNRKWNLTTKLAVNIWMVKTDECVGKYAYTRKQTNFPVVPFYDWLCLKWNVCCWNIIIPPHNDPKWYNTHTSTLVPRCKVQKAHAAAVLVERWFICLWCFNPLFFLFSYIQRYFKWIFSRHRKRQN